MQYVHPHYWRCVSATRFAVCCHGSIVWPHGHLKRMQGRRYLSHAGVVDISFDVSGTLLKRGQYGELADGNEEFDDEVMGEEEEEEEEEHTDHRHHVAYARRRGGPTGMARTALPPLPVQKAVQPGSTVSATSGAERQWLAYNMLGCAARRVEGGGSGQATVEVPNPHAHPGVLFVPQPFTCGSLFVLVSSLTQP
jgi:hypothetical protein